MAFEVHQKVLFKLRDTAGIVFCRRPFKIMNDCVEALFDEARATPFENLILRLTRFCVGTSAATYLMAVYCADQLRFETTSAQLYLDTNGIAAVWPDDLRPKLTAFKDNCS